MSNFDDTNGQLLVTLRECIDLLLIVCERLGMTAGSLYDHNADPEAHAAMRVAISKVVQECVAYHDDANTAHPKIITEVNRLIASALGTTVDVAAAITAHNIFPDAHADMRNILTTLQTTVAGLGGSSGGKHLRLSVYNTAGVYTHTYHTDTTLVEYIVTSAGGGSAGNLDAIGGGGGAGGTAIGMLAITAVREVVVTVGAGGDGGSTTGKTGLVGGTSSLGTAVSVTGGKGGTSTAGGLGGGNSSSANPGYQILCPGGPGSPPPVNFGTGAGGISYWGGTYSGLKEVGKITSGYKASPGGGAMGMLTYGARGADGIIVVREYA